MLFSSVFCLFLQNIRFLDTSKVFTVFRVDLLIHLFRLMMASLTRTDTSVGFIFKTAVVIWRYVSNTELNWNKYFYLGCHSRMLLPAGAYWSKMFMFVVLDYILLRIPKDFSRFKSLSKMALDKYKGRNESCHLGAQKVFFFNLFNLKSS